MIRVQATREQTVATRYRVECEKNRVSREMIHFLFYFRKLGFLSLGGDFSCDATAGDFLDLIDVGLSPRRSQMDPAEERRETKRHPAEERRETKRQKEFINMQGYVADSEYKIPTRCPCGGRIIDEVRGKDDYDTLSGKRFFSCKKYEADGFHYRQPWVIGVQEHIERLTKRVEEVELVIKWVPETEVKALNREVDNLTGQVYNLSVQVADLEKVTGCRRWMRVDVDACGRGCLFFISVSLGMIGSIDCMHWEWKNCPTAWKGQYTHGSGKPTIVLEVVASQDLWIWHAFFGLPCTLNDINVLDRSPVFDDILQGRAPKVKFKVNNHTYRMAYYLTDGIYPNWSTFIQSITLLQGPKAELFAERQESAIKDVERAFGVLQSRFAIVKNPALLWDKEKIRGIMRTCVILHSMIVENERDGYTQIDTSEFESGESSRSSKVKRRTSFNIGNMLGIRNEVRDSEKHDRSKADLVENV
uniref:Uncharacterized protein n=1 Tax=Brassica oleracea var. oleracea TaxID=109376 RepID=A0A0D3ACA7_BRAOL